MSNSSESIIRQAETAIRASVQSIEDQYAGVKAEDVDECEYFDACGNPPNSSSTGEDIPNWQTGGTVYHSFCGSGTSVITSLPEAPNCSPLTSTVCGLDVSFDRATIKFLTNTDLEDDGTRQAVCVQRNLDTEWHTSFAGILDSDNYVEYVYSTVGATGMLMQYPGVEWGSCPSSYDPRFRPWYAAATTGPKKVVIVIDVSGSMTSNGRLGLAREAALKVLDTLSDYDYVGIVQFSASASTYASTLVPVTTDTKCLLEDYIYNIRTGGTTNYEAAFNRAFNLLGTGSSHCGPEAILFLTDGDVTEGAKGSELYNIIDDLQHGTDAVIFTYALGSGVDSSVTKEIACRSGGVAYEVPDSGDLATTMASYFDFFAAQVEPETIAPVWTRYREYNSGQFAASVCMSAHDDAQFEETGVTRLLGVVCADLSEAHVSAVDGSLDEFDAAIEISRTQCPVFITPTDNELRIIRDLVPGSPLSCGVDWYAWGIPLIVVGVVAVVVIFFMRAKLRAKAAPAPSAHAAQATNAEMGQTPAATRPVEHTKDGAIPTAEVVTA